VINDSIARHLNCIKGEAVMEENFCNLKFNSSKYCTVTAVYLKCLAVIIGSQDVYCSPRKDID
jgi:hypothetical protein